MQPNLLLHHCVHWEGFQKPVKSSPLRDKGTQGALGKKQVICPGWKELMESTFTQQFIYSLIYSLNTLLRGILLLPGRRGENKWLSRPPRSSSVRERCARSQKGSERVGIKRSAERGGSTEKAPFTQPGDGDNGGAPVVAEHLKLLGWQWIGNLREVVPQSRSHRAECTMLPGAPPLPVPPTTPSPPPRLPTSH